MIFTIFVVSRCAYLGFHGPSILATPDIHSEAGADEECLECHYLDKEQNTPLTPHPNFKGCAKCHTDPVSEEMNK